MACTHSTTCPLIRVFAGKASLRIWTQWYCEGNFGRCARYKRLAFGQAVPPTLLPNGQSLELPGESACA
jgi:hypothetical protein